jgi:hypothetical protein
MRFRCDRLAFDSGDTLAQRNYRQAKRQKEEARKTRQLQKQQRRSERTTEEAVSGTEPAADAALVERDSPSGGSPLPLAVDGSHAGQGREDLGLETPGAAGLDPAR